MVLSCKQGPAWQEPLVGRYSTVGMYSKLNVVNGGSQTCAIGRGALCMRVGMRNAWPHGRVAVCTSQPVSEIRVCLWVRLQPDFCSYRATSHPQTSLGHRCQPSRYRYPRPTHQQSRSNEASAITRNYARCTGRLFLSYHGPFAISALRTNAW